MIYFVSALHVVLCVFMIFVILLQPGKDAGMGAALGGGAATSAFGGRGAVTFLGKVTAVCAIAYFITSLGLSFVGLHGSVAEEAARKAAEKAAAAKPPETPKPTDAPKPGEPAKTDTAAPPGTDAPPVQAPADAPKAPEAPKPGEAVPGSPNTVEKPSENPGKPVPPVPDKPKGTEAGP